MSDRWRLIEGDCLAVLPGLEAGLADAVCTDPPYGLEFMGKEWDQFKDTRGRGVGAGFAEGGFKSGNGYAKRRTPAFGKRWVAVRCRKCGHQQAGGSPCQCKEPDFFHEYEPGTPKTLFAYQEWVSSWAAALLPAVRPGGYLLAFGGTRTHHRLMCAIEDAGWEIRDTVAWVYGSGFPKGKGNLKPAWEMIVLARRPGPKVLPLQVDECRVPGVPRSVPQPVFNSPTGRTYAIKTGMGRNGEMSSASAGRYPANLVHDGSPEVLEAFARAGERSGPRVPARRPADGKGYCGLHTKEIQRFAFDDSGTAARFYYTAKASKRERWSFCRDCQDAFSDRLRAEHLHGHYGEDGKEDWQHIVGHPTVKPLALIEYLVRLVCPEGGLCLDPFAGSGTTGVACLRTGRRFIGIEKEPEYCRIARRRLEAEVARDGLFAEGA